jgi:hypothetical protein
MSGAVSSTLAGPTTQLIPFTPPSIGMFSFTATLDGEAYTVQVQWNYAGQRWYLNFFLQTNSTGIPDLSVAMVGSPPNASINNFIGGTSTVIWRPSTGNFEVTS